MYWVRRLLALGVVSGVVLAMVLGIARLLDYSSGDSKGEQATPVASSPGPSDAQTDRRREKSSDGRGKQDKADRKKEQDKLARPEGPCDDGDVLVTPTVSDAHLGGPVKIVLEVTSIEAEACYWEVSPESVFLNIESDYGTIWSSQQCPDAVPTEQVVPRQERAAKVEMWWNGKESDDGCPSWAPWVETGGSYSAVAAALGSVTPVTTGFYLGPAVAPTITQTPTPTPSPTETDKKRRSDRKNQPRNR